MDETTRGSGFRRSDAATLMGAGWDALWRDTVSLVVFAVVLVTIATLRFQKSVE